MFSGPAAHRHLTAGGKNEYVKRMLQMCYAHFTCCYV